MIEVNGQYGIIIKYGDRVLISDNQILGNENHGIYQMGDYGEIRNNIIRGNGGDGILLYDSCNNTVTDNSLEGNGNYGIREYGTSDGNTTQDRI